MAVSENPFEPVDHSRSNRGVQLYHRALNWRLQGLPDNADGAPMGTIGWLFASSLRLPALRN